MQKGNFDMNKIIEAGGKDSAVSVETDGNKSVKLLISKSSLQIPSMH